MVENRDGQDMVEKSCVSQSWNFNDVARFWALWSFVLQQPGQETGSGMDALCLLFNHNVAPFLCIMAAESGKKLPHRSHIPLQRLDRPSATLCLSGRLSATLWVKPPPSVVAGDKERREGTAKLCLKNWPFYG